MPVDLNKPARWLVVHGVQVGDDSDLKQDETILTELRKQPAAQGLDFTTSLYRYENINDEAQSMVRSALSLLKQSIVAEHVVDKLFDVVGDVVINWRQGETAKKIGQGLKDTILEAYVEQTPLFILAHSLGSIYAFDVVNELMSSDEYYTGSIESWPVQGLVTIGSPIGLGMFQRQGLQEMSNQEELFEWINIWDRTDPVVSGNVFGLANSDYEIAGRFPDIGSGWAKPQDIVLDTTHHHLASHVSYWERPEVSRHMLSIMT